MKKHTLLLGALVLFGCFIFADESTSQRSHAHAHAHTQSAKAKSTSSGQTPTEGKQISESVIE